ncbi:MAG: T9SS type A sorting domain-containing protein [Ignavibacteria bacterium]|nr:T9SS type A sorting domain-containing protein [Ignavibacteria bacterium]
MVGTTKGNFAIAGGLGTSSDDILFILINENGDILNRKLFNSSGIESDYSSSIFETSDNGFLITGYTTYLQSTQIDQNIYLIKTDSLGNAPTVNINIIENQLPAGFKLYQNYPNPFNPATLINYELSNSEFISLKVFDILGNEVKTLVNEKQNAGRYSVEFSGADLPSGVYYYRLSSGNFNEVKMMTLIK